MKNLKNLGFLGLLFISHLSACTSTSSNPTTQFTVPAGSVTDREQVRATIKRALPDIKECYLTSLKEKPDLKGKVVIQFEVDDQGKVPKCEIKSSDMATPEVDKCVCDKISNTLFPPAPKEQKASIVYPFIFDYKD